METQEQPIVVACWLIVMVRWLLQKTPKDFGFFRTAGRVPRCPAVVRIGEHSHQRGDCATGHAPDGICLASSAAGGWVFLAATSCGSSPRNLYDDRRIYWLVVVVHQGSINHQRIPYYVVTVSSMVVTANHKSWLHFFDSPSQTWRADALG